MKNKSVSTSHQQEAFNQFLNFFWTALSFAPLLWFWFKEGAHLWFWIFLSVSLLFGFLPEKIMQQLQISHNRKFYENLGVKLISRFVQNGSAVRSMQKDRRNMVISGKTQAANYLRTIKMYERFHWMCFLFFLLTTLWGYLNDRMFIATLIVFSNILYNVYPLLLQQYNKLRIMKIVKG